MPFTLAHAAAALPLRGSRLVWSALVVGTFAPDFEYFLRFAPDDGYGHTVPGTFVLTLPLAILTLWLFHAFVERPLIELLPDAVRRRLPNNLNKFRFAGPPRFAMIVLSVLAGIATHLMWDSFTHPNTWPYRTWLVLREPVSLPTLGAVPLYKIFQHGSTVIGFLILFVWFLLWYRRTNSSQVGNSWSSPSHKALVLGVMAGVAMVGALVRAGVAIGIPQSHLAQRRFLGLLVVTLIALLWWQIVFYGVWRRRAPNT